MAKFTRAKIREILGDAHTQEIEDAVMKAHLEVVTPMREELDELRPKADDYDKQKQELDDLKGKDLETKYNALKTEYEDYKAKTESEKSLSAIKEKYKSLLKAEGVADKRIDAVLKVTDFSGMKLGKNGELEGADKLKEAIKTDWSDFIESERTEGKPASNPPQGGGTGGSRAKEIAQRIYGMRYGDTEKKE